MSYDPNYKRGRGRGGRSYNNSPPRTFNKYQDHSPKDNFADRGFRGSRRPSGLFTKNLVRDDYRPRDDRRSSRESYERERYRPRESKNEPFNNFRDRNGGTQRRSPFDYHKDYSRARPPSPDRISFREIPSRSRNFEPNRRTESRNDYTPPARFRMTSGDSLHYPSFRDHHVSPIRHSRDNYEGSSRPRYYEQEQFSDRKQIDFKTSNQREVREYRSRSPNPYSRGSRFNGVRGGRGKDNYGR